MKAFTVITATYGQENDLLSQGEAKEIAEKVIGREIEFTSQELLIICGISNAPLNSTWIAKEVIAHDSDVSRGYYAIKFELKENEK